MVRNRHWLRGWRLVGRRSSLASIRPVSCGTLKSLGEPRRIDWTSEDSEWAPCADVAILQPFKACADGKLHKVGRQIAGFRFRLRCCESPCSCLLATSNDHSIDSI